MSLQNSLSSDQKSFFALRGRAFSKTQPEFRQLRRILLNIGGEETAPPSSPDPMISFLIDYGIAFAGPVVFRPVKSGHCAAGIARAWRRQGVVGIGVGYGLDGNGLWREHTFGILREGVLEMGTKKQKYFGLMLIGEAADGFAAGLLGRKKEAAAPPHKLM